MFKLGDTVFTIPTIRELQKYYKNEITIVCYPESVPIYKEGLSNVHYLPLPHDYFYFGGRIAKSKARKQLITTKPETIFDLNGAMTSVSLFLFCRSKKNVGMSYEMFRAVYDHFVLMERFPHMMDRYHKIISQIVPLDQQSFSKEFPKSKVKNKVVLIHPFAAWKSREWNLRKYIELTIKLSEYYDASLIMLNKSIDNDLVSEIKRLGIKLILTNSVDELVENIKKCAALIGNDSGPIHIADLLGKPTFCIFGPTNPIYSEPIGKHHSKFKSEIKCAPKGIQELCFTDGGRKGCPSFECMKTITVDTILEEVLIFLKENI